MPAPAETTEAQPAPPAATEPAGDGATALQLVADPDGALAFGMTSLEAPAGNITIEFENESSVPHNVTIEGVNAATKTFTAGRDSLTVELEPGTYTFFCSVPGHREAGMEGTLTVE